MVAGNGCVPSWGGVQPIGNGASGGLLTALSTSIASYRAKGGEVAVSFGGANGTPLMQACTTVPALASAYQTVIDTCGLTHVDFDIEGASQTDTAAVARNFQAVTQLQASYAAKGKPLHVTLTLPTMPTETAGRPERRQRGDREQDRVRCGERDGDGLRPANLDMGAAAISAAQALYSQLDTAFKSAGQPKTNAQLWQMVGVTPMIGVNDVQGETFTLANAQSVLNAAVSNGYGFFGNWSVGRDQACPSGGTYASPTCSGVAQRRTRSRRSSSGSTASGARASRRIRTTAAARTAARRTGRAWAAGQVCRPARRSPTGTTYQAQWWTQGRRARLAAVWKVVGGGTPVVGNHRVFRRHLRDVPGARNTARNGGRKATTRVRAVCG